MSFQIFLLFGNLQDAGNIEYRLDSLGDSPSGS